MDRVASTRVKQKKHDILQVYLICLREHCYRKRYARMAFVNRFHYYRIKWQLQSIWNILLNNATTLKIQRSLMTFTAMVIKNKVWQFWRKLFHLRKREKLCLNLIPSMLYVLGVRRYFLVWRVKTKISFNLARQSLQSHAWLRWRKSLAAQLQWRFTFQSKVFNAWKLHINSIDSKKRMEIHRRRRIMKVVIRYGLS